MIVTALDIRLANDLAEFPPLIDALEWFCAAAAVPEKAAYRLQLTVDEFVNNAVDYGYPDGRGGEITIGLRHADTQLHVVLTDDGDPFDPLAAPPPDLTGSLEERRIGGLGVHLVKTLASSVAYARTEGRNVLTLTLSLAG